MIGFLPNALSLIRLGLGLVFPFVPPGWQPWLVLIGAATDLVDGRLARLLGTDGRFGKYLDPVADKVFVLGVLIAVVRDGLVPPAGLIALTSRDLTVVFGVLTLVATGRRDLLARLGPSLLGKLTTAIQFAYLFAVIWVREPLELVLLIVALLTAAAAIDYLRRGLQAAMGTRVAQGTVNQEPIRTGAD